MPIAFETKTITLQRPNDSRQLQTIRFIAAHEVNIMKVVADTNPGKAKILSICLYTDRNSYVDTYANTNT